MKSSLTRILVLALLLPSLAFAHGSHEHDFLPVQDNDYESEETQNAGIWATIVHHKFKSAVFVAVTTISGALLLKRPVGGWAGMLGGAATVVTVVATNPSIQCLVIKTTGSLVGVDLPCSCGNGH